MMHRLATKRTTKNELPPESQYTCNGVCRAASRHSAETCAEYDRLSQQQL